jgi:hypothetical protein
MRSSVLLFLWRRVREPVPQVDELLPKPSQLRLRRFDDDGLRGGRDFVDYLHWSQTIPARVQVGDVSVVTDPHEFARGDDSGDPSSTSTGILVGMPVELSDRRLQPPRAKPEIGLLLRSHRPVDERVLIEPSVFRSEGGAQVSRPSRGRAEQDQKHHENSSHL